MKCVVCKTPLKECKLRLTCPHFICNQCLGREMLKMKVRKKRKRKKRIKIRKIKRKRKIKAVIYKDINIKFEN